MLKIPPHIQKILEVFKKVGFSAYIVGGSTRAFLLSKIPKDWDIATSAKPEEIIELFPESFYDNQFGTVGVKIKEGEKTKEIVEITTYRLESKYSDARHPDEIKFTKGIKDDLARRDFTINAMALSSEGEIIDLFSGQDDLKRGLIRAVNDPYERFSEDALRMLRAIRFAAVLDFKIEKNTFQAITKNSKLIQKIAGERIREEFIAIIMSDNPKKGIQLMQESGLLRYIIPELEIGVGVSQNKHHKFTVFQHSVLSLANAKTKNLPVRLAALFHDIAKPKTKKGEGEDATFYNHELAGARMTAQILKRLKFSQDIIKKTAHLVENHMFYYNTGEVSEAGVRRLLKKVGLENIKDLMDLRIADRLGSGVPKAKPYKLRHLEYLVDKVSKAPISVKMLKASGDDMVKIGMKPGPKFGAILDCLLAEVIEEPKLNEKEILLAKIKKLAKLNLAELRKKAKEVIKKEKEKEDKIIKGKHWVK